MNAFVLLHGFTGRPDSWDDVIALLPGGTTVLRPALRGHDAAARDPGSGFAGEVDRIAAIVRGRGLAGSHLAGYSLGARVALGLLARHPGLFARATLIGVNPGLSDAAARADRAADDERWARLLETGGVERFAAAWEAQPLFATQARLSLEARAAEHARRRSHTAAGLALALRTLGLAAMPDHAPLLSAITVPVTLVAGEDDPRFCAFAITMAAALPRCRVRLVPGSGHNVLLERPAAVATALLEEAP